MWNSFHVSPVHLMYTDKMKAQINEKSTIEISLYTQLANLLLLNYLDLTHLITQVAHLNGILYHFFLQLHLVPNIKRYTMCQFKHCLKRKGRN